MMIPCNRIAYFFMVSLIIGLSCSKTQPVSGIEITNGNCIGKIYNSDGSAVKDAIVKLIPFDFNPYSHAGQAIDSTRTNTFGAYAFNVSQPNYYNVIAEKGSASCMKDSIFVQTDAKTIVDNDTLRESGWLSGNVRLKPGDDSHTAVILVLGTNVYAVPSDTSGSFVTPLLSKGNYVIQIFTTLDGYAVFDTNVTIREGAQTQLDVTLSSENAPSIAKLTATYDSAAMFVSLSWPMPDTSGVALCGYALYRKSAAGRDTTMYIDKWETSYTDDVIGFDGDSMSYQIAGIGKNYKEGYRTPAAKPIIVCGEVYCIKKLDMSRIVVGFSPGYVDVFADQESYIFLVGKYGVYKLDTNGIVRKDLRLDFNDQSDYWVSGLQGDDRGFLYIQKKSDDTLKVVKFDTALNVISQLPLDSGCYSFVAGKNGTIYAFYHVTDSATGACTGIKKYDSTFTFIKEFRIMKRDISNPTCFGDTIVIIEYQPTDDNHVFCFYDTAFTPLSVVVPVDTCKGACGNPQFSSQVRYNGFIAAPNGIFVSVCYSRNPINDSSLLLFTDRNGKFLARIVVPGRGGLSFDSRGYLYFLTYKYPEHYDDMGVSNPPETLFKYTIEPLLRKISP